MVEDERFTMHSFAYRPWEDDQSSCRWASARNFTSRPGSKVYSAAVNFQEVKASIVVMVLGCLVLQKKSRDIPRDARVMLTMDCCAVLGTSALPA